MAFAPNILRSYIAPRAVFRSLQARGRDEGRALAILMGGCALIFVAQWPRLAREAHLNPDIGLDARIGGALLGWLFIMPLVFYAVAALSHLVARLLGGQGHWYDARLALFWTVLATAPGFLLVGLLSGLAGPGAAVNLVALLLLLAFLYIWGNCLIAAERAPLK